MSSEINSLSSILAILAVASASALIGVFALTRRMTLAADAISHVALPGLGLAILFGVNPLLGGAAALVIGALLVWFIEGRTRIATETIIGVVFSASLAIGALLIPTEEELLDALFGDFSALTFRESLIGIAIAGAIILLIYAFKEKLTLSFVSQDLAKTSGLNVSKLNLLFLMMFVAAIILGLKFLGILLMGALVIVPAATSRNLARSFNSDLLLAVFSAAVAVLIGIWVSTKYTLAIGPTIITVASILFFLSIFFKKEN